MSQAERFWWTPIELAVGEGRRWRLGTLELVLLRSDSEWHMAHRHLPDDEVVLGAWSVDSVLELGEESANTERFASDPSARQVQVLPRVAERSVVASPRVPLHVLPNHEAKFYVSSPVWVEVYVGPPLVALRSVPAKRLSDTWFGPSTREGEVAFALKTQARVHLAEIPKQVQRAITPVVAKNRADTLLSIDRLNLPVPYLSIFHTDEGDLWTEAVVLEHREDTDMAGLAIDPGAPQEARGGAHLSDPRTTADEHLLVRAFSSILRTFDLGS